MPPRRRPARAERPPCAVRGCVVVRPSTPGGPTSVARSFGRDHQADARPLARARVERELRADEPRGLAHLQETEATACGVGLQGRADVESRAIVLDHVARDLSGAIRADYPVAVHRRVVGSPPPGHWLRSQLRDAGPLSRSACGWAGWAQALAHAVPWRRAFARPHRSRRRRLPTTRLLSALRCDALRQECRSR